jgi:hypothetical protein
LWVVGYGIQQFYVSSGIEIPVGYAADAFFLAGNAGLIAALVLLLRSRESRFDSSLDVGIVVLAVSQLAWATLISKYALDGTLPLLGRATQIAYAFTDVVMLALVARILVAPGKRTASFLLVPGTSGTKAVLEVSDTGARAIVDAHEGTIGVVSSEGAETISRIELPLARDTRTNRPSEVAA